MVLFAIVHGIFRSWSLSEKVCHWGDRLWGFMVLPHFLLFLSASCMRMKIWSDSFPLLLTGMPYLLPWFLHHDQQYVLETVIPNIPLSPLSFLWPCHGIFSTTEGYQYIAAHILLLICISLMNNDIEHLFCYLLMTWIFFPLWCSHVILLPILYWVVLLGYRSTFYIAIYQIYVLFSSYL